MSDWGDLYSHWQQPMWSGYNLARSQFAVFGSNFAGLKPLLMAWKLISAGSIRRLRAGAKQSVLTDFHDLPTRILVSESVICARFHSNNANRWYAPCKS